jgi:hypothetical protein
MGLRAVAGFALLLISVTEVRAEEGVVVVRPEAAAGPVDNPLKGWCPYPNAGRIGQPYSMVFQYVSWRELEPKEGEYRFEEWEKRWDEPAARDKHVIFRVWIDYPKRPSGLPEWLREAGVRETAYEDHGGGKSPDYDDPRLVAALERLIAALGRRYDGDPRVAFVQAGLLGFWGEWHTYPRTKLYASPETERRVIEAYRRAFPNKKLMVRYARGHASEQPWIGFHDDMFPEDTDNGREWSFLAGLRRSGRTENWRTAVIGGEMVPGQAERWLEAEYETTRTMVERAHFTWAGPYGPALARSENASFRERSAELVRRMGYEFQLTEVTHPAAVKTGRPVRLSLQGKNNGVAPFYYPWAVEWALLEASGKVVAVERTDWDVRRWLPGEFAESAEVTFDVPPGRYRLGLGIRDPWKDRPAIGFANAGAVTEGWTVLSELRVPE